MLTADTITDDQIRALRNAVESADAVDYNTVDVCDLALIPRTARYVGVHKTPMTTRDARARCAEILNARAAKAKT